MAEQVGEIYYTVDMLTRPMVEKSAELEARLGKLEGAIGPVDKASGKLGAQMTKTAQGVQQANRAASGATSAFGQLYKILAAYIGLQTVRSLVAMSDEYGQMASRIRQVTADTAEYERVQARLLQTANATYRPLAEAQEVFIRTADSIRDLGYTTDQALDITDSFSFLLVTNAASADRANSAISAYSKSIQTGKIQSDQWQSILAAMPSIVDGVAEATGRSREEIKKLGVEGKLSLEALNEGLRRSRDENEALAAEMETSVKDAFTALRNSMQVFVGKVNETSGATGVLTDAVGELSTILQDPETIAAAQELAAGVVTALGKIIDVAKEVVNVTRWMADEMAATFNGAALDDVVRMQDQLQTFQGMLDNPLKRLRIGGDGQAIKLFSEEEIKKNIDQLRINIDAFFKEQENRPPLPSPVPPPEAQPNPEAPKIVEAEAKAVEKKTTARKKLTEAEREAIKVQRELQRAQESDAKTLADLQEALYQTTLNADELIARKAELSLSQYATPEQIAQVKALNAELARTEEIEKRKKAFGDGSVRSKILGDTTPLQGGAFDDQTARYEAEAIAEQERYAAQQERLVEALELELITKGEYWQLEEEMFQAHSDRLQQIDQARMEMQLTQWSQGFGQMASDMAAFGQAFADENSAMFKVAKAAAVAQAIIQTYQGAQQAFTAMSSIPYVGPALGIAAAAAAVAGGMARVAQIRSQNISGGRLYGGPVSAGSMYRVNENGAPEVFQARNGRQFMIPSANGEVISNRDAARSGSGGSAGGNVTVNQTIQVTGQVDRQTSTQLARDAAQKQSIAQARFGG